MARRFHDLADLQRADAEAMEAAHWALRGRGFWVLMGLWTKRLSKVSDWLKAVGAVLVAVTVVVTAGVKAVELLRARGVAPAETPATGIASTTVDRAPTPPLPK
jgi:hypothetical protein